MAGAKVGLSALSTDQTRRLPGEAILSSDNCRLFIITRYAPATKTFAGDCGCESSSKGIDDLITGLAEVANQVLGFFRFKVRGLGFLSVLS